MIDETQARKSFEKILKTVPTTVAKLDEDLIHIILGVHVCLQDEKKVLAWLKTKNLNLGGVQPIQLMNMGRAGKVRAFVEAAIEERFNDGKTKKKHASRV
jgi:hypothetical protein